MHENGTCDRRWVEPADPEDVTFTFEYELVYASEDAIEEFWHIYYDMKNDQLLVNVDGILVTMNRVQ